MGQVKGPQLVAIGRNRTTLRVLATLYRADRTVTGREDSASRVIGLSCFVTSAKARHPLTIC